MLRVIVPGSFDPPTLGHMDLIKRSSEIFDEVHVVIASHHLKTYTFSSDERVGLMQDLLEEYNNVSLHSWKHLIVDFARKINAQVIVRGLRSVSDVRYELDLSMINRSINDDIETIFLPTHLEYMVARSSMVKELAKLGGDVSKLVPKSVAEALRKKFA